jgi:hypothetical protein
MYDPQYIRLGGLGLTNTGFIEIVNNMQDDIKRDTLEIYLGNNSLNGKLSFSSFPNLKKLTCSNNDISELEEPLPRNLTAIYMYNNSFTQLPKLPNNLQYLHVSGCPLKNLPILPASLEYLSVNANLLYPEDDNPSIDFKNLPFKVKKSIVILLNKKDFRHDFTETELQVLQEFKQQQRDVANFKHAVALSKNYDELRVENRNNKNLQKMYSLFVVVNVLEFLGGNNLN